uniref:Plasminogen receptor, C-terminal lysine transmembrane protein n=1 Tax=Oncorhynchus kisutch TaxID=8019 RepID=A0A8C7JUQ3_ONCKI
MGFMLSKSMDQNFKKQQEFMLHNARLQMERQILMQNQMRERQMAMQIAWSREFLKYYGTFFSLAALGLTIGAIKKKKPVLFAPVVPLSFVLAYQMDMGYGTLIYRMRGKQRASWSQNTTDWTFHTVCPTSRALRRQEEPRPPSAPSLRNDTVMMGVLSSVTPL